MKKLKQGLPLLLNRAKFIGGCRLFLTVLLLFLCSSIFAASSLQQQIQFDQSRLQQHQDQLRDLHRQRKRLLQQYVNVGIAKKDLTNASLMVTNAQADISNLDIELTNVTEDISYTQNEIAEIKSKIKVATFALNSKGSETLRLLAKDKARMFKTLSLLQRRQTILLQTKKIATQRLQIVQAWHEQIQQLFRLQLQEGYDETVMHSSEHLKKEQRAWFDKLNQLNKSLNQIAEFDPASMARRAKLQFEILVLREKIGLSRIQVYLMQLHTRLQPFMVVGMDPASLGGLQLQSTKSSKILQELRSLQQLIKRKGTALQQHLTIIQNNYQTKEISKKEADQQFQVLKKLIIQYQDQLQRVVNFNKQVLAYQQQMRQMIRAQITVRQTLPGLDWDDWNGLLRNLILTPRLILRSLQDVLIQVYYQLAQMQTLMLSLIIIAMMLLISGWIFLRKSFFRLLVLLEDQSKRFSSQVLAVMIRLVRRNLGALILLAVLIVFTLSFSLDLTLWISFIVAYLCYRVASLLARFWLVEHDGEVHAKDRQLFRGLNRVFIAALVLTLLMLVVHVLPVAYEVKVLFNKAFMVLLLVFSFLLFRAWSVLPNLLQRAFAVKRRYIRQVIRIITWVLPVTLFSNAIIGLAGYVDLAWLIGLYQATFIIVLVLYMVARGLVIDFMELAYELTVRHFKSGWLLAQAFMKPLDRIFRFVLFLFAIYCLAILWQLDQNHALVDYWQKFKITVLIDFFGNRMTIVDLAGLTLFVVFLYWLVKWSREFSFRWMYNKAKDVGARNSLAVFTQYVVVVVGIIVGFRIFGIELKGLAVIAAAFVAAVGFGMRDIVANFLSGVMLLFERPFRAGDTISLGTYEGEVLSSGIRSLKIRTWDRMDVIVPNMDIFTKPFVNWTHQDSIVRSVIKINVNRSDDPHRIQELILGILVDLASVVDQPSPEVLMKEISESLVELEIRYFINLHVERSRSRVRSEVLFAIWDSFKENGIKAPFPVQEILLNKA